MAIARLALKNLQQRASLSILSSHINNRGMALPQQRWDFQLLRRLTTATSENVSDQKSQGRDVAVSEGSSKKSKLFPTKRRRRGFWRNNKHDLLPFSLNEVFPSRLGDALLQASENLNRLFENLTPSRLMGRMKEDEKCYKLRYEVPGLAKEDVKITIEDRFLTIIGEHKEEEEEGSDDERWSSASYGYYNTTFLLPDDANVDEVKAELKDGVLTINIPRAESQGKDVKEVEIH